jgi:hypothetical protein
MDKVFQNDWFANPEWAGQGARNVQTATES